MVYEHLPCFSAKLMDRCEGTVSKRPRSCRSVMGFIRSSERIVTSGLHDDGSQTTRITRESSLFLSLSHTTTTRT